MIAPPGASHVSHKSDTALRFFGIAYRGNFSAIVYR